MKTKHRRPRLKTIANIKNILLRLQQGQQLNVWFKVDRSATRKINKITFNTNDQLVPTRIFRQLIQQGLIESIHHPSHAGLKRYTISHQGQQWLQTT